MQPGSRRPPAVLTLGVILRNNGNATHPPPRWRHSTYRALTWTSRADRWIGLGWKTVVRFVLAISAKQLRVWAMRDRPHNRNGLIRACVGARALALRNHYRGRL